MEAMNYGCSDNNGMTPALSANDTSLSGLEEINCGLSRKTPLQLQTLENLYYEDKHPTQSTMKDYAFALGLTFEQVRGWFVNRRKKDKTAGVQTKAKKKKSQSDVKCRNKIRAEEEIHEESDSIDSEDDRYSYVNMCRPFRTQDKMYPSEYIIQKVFRKDGPPLGAEFDLLPSAAFQRRYCGRLDMENYGASHGDDRITLDTQKIHEARSLSCQHGDSVKRHGMGKGLMTTWRVLNAQNDCQQAKRRKVLSCNDSLPMKRHGIGKGLMTVWRALHPDGGNYPGGSKLINSRKKKHVAQNKKGRKKQRNRRMVGNKLQNKMKPAIKRQKVGHVENESQIEIHKKECKLALEAVRYELPSHTALVDDEELELTELQAGPNPLTCTTHFSTGARHGCPLCKGFLPKFPPNSVRMKCLLYKHPWDSSLELVKKFFKVFHFLYTYAVVVDVRPFTIEEFLQAFHDKDSLLLGELHLCLLKHLLLDIEKDFGSCTFSCTSKNCMFVSLLNSVQSSKFTAKFLKKSLNPLTWTEILRQVLVAAGYGAGDCVQRKEGADKEVNPMMKYGLSRGTLTGELFSILMGRGKRGATILELAEYAQIESLNLTNTKEELEGMICSVLASDIKLFEKISKLAYRLRSNNLFYGDENIQSETDPGSIDYLQKECGVSGNEDFDCDSGSSNSSGTKNASHNGHECSMSSPGTEIDESHPGEAWVLGLVEGEYSDLSIEEKMNILVALVDLLSAGSSIRMEDLEMAITECVPKVYPNSTGAKIKKSSATQNSFNSTVQRGAVGRVQKHCTEVQPVDSASILHGKDKVPGDNIHPMQSIFLGSDRRYNRYWLFLGPCIAGDPGHRRVYFESSEDGHWEIIETEAALCALIGALDSRGGREAILLAALENRAPFLFEEMLSRADDSCIRQPSQSDQSELDRVNCESLSPVSDVDNNSGLFGASVAVVPSPNTLVQDAEKIGEEKTLKWRRLQAYDMWIWNLFYSNLHSVKFRRCSFFDTFKRCEICHDLYWRDEKHCRCCHKTFELDFELEEKYAIHVATCHVKDDAEADAYPMHKVLPSQLQALKAAILAIELAMPEDALIGSWAKSAHNLWVKRLRRTSSLPELLQVLADLLGALNEEWLSQRNVAVDCNMTFEELVACFPHIPQTSSALALWLVKLDSLISSEAAKEPEGVSSTGDHARGS